MLNSDAPSHRRPWILILPILIGLFMAYVNLEEWYVVGVARDIAGYPFGGEGPVPYYYKTPELYSTVNLVFGSVFLCLTLLSIWSLVKKRRGIGFLAFAMIIATIAVMYINGQIAP
jgi:hypothetical protein